MRYLITGEWNRHHLMRIIMIFFMIYILFFWVTNFILYFYHMSLTPDSVVLYYRGSEKDFIPAKSFLGLLEVTHAHLFAMGTLLVTLTHLLLFVPGNEKIKICLSVIVLSAGLLDITAGWLVLYVDSLFAYLKIGAFLTLQLGIGALIVLINLSLYYKHKLSYKSEPKHSKVITSMSSTKKVASLVIALLTTCTNLTKAEELNVYTQSRLSMGTLLNISICSNSKEKAQNMLNSSFAKIQKVEELISEWQNNSEINKLSNQPPGSEIKLDQITYDFLEFGKQMYQLSNGAIDLGIGAITKRRSIKSTINRPTADDLILLPNLHVSLKKSPLIFDTGAIGKGYSLDYLESYLRKKGVKCALVDFGGSSVLGIGSPPNSKLGWKLKAINNQIINIIDQSVSTSSSLKDQLNETHIYSPRQNKYVNKHAGVTVIGKSSALVDALSTWILIDGTDRVQNVLTQNKISGVRIINQ